MLKWYRYEEIYIYFIIYSCMYLKMLLKFICLCFVVKTSNNKFVMLIIEILIIFYKYMFEEELIVCFINVFILLYLCNFIWSNLLVGRNYKM